MNAHRLVAHRGDNTNFPENSYAGLEAALKAGARYIEFDIQMNKDGSLLVFHDTNFKRTANNNASIFNTSNNDLKNISVHEPKRFGEKHFPTPVPYLSDILNLLKQYPDAQALVEVKKESLKHWGLERVMKPLLSSLIDLQSQIIVISFSGRALEYIKQYSDIRTGYVFKKYLDKFKKKARELEPDYLICPYKIIPNHLWKGHWQWALYSINSKELATSLFRRGDINLIETDNIRDMLQS